MDLFDLPPPPPTRRGIGGHQAATPATTTWLTPPEITGALGTFDLDPCAFPGWPTARRLICLPENGLAATWERWERVWLNPPYTTGEVERWLRRLADHGRGTALIFARTETEAFHAHVWERAAGLLFLRGRLHFHRPDGSRAEANAGAPSVLCAYGADDLDQLAASGLEGALTPLRFARFVMVAAMADAPRSWREIVAQHMGRGPVSVSDLYRAIARHPRTTETRHWRAKVRQTLQRHFTRTGPAQWAAA